MEIKEFVDRVKELNIIYCKDCPFGITAKLGTNCKLKGSLCIGKENKIEELLKVEEYLKEKEHEI
ncbi:MAG: hypothetical protein ACLR02_10015 [Clostridium sp.]